MVDEELNHIIHRAKRGDREAFADLVKRYKGHVYRYAVGMLSDRMDAEDVSQEAFIKAYYSLSSLDNEYAFSSWMIRIVSNLCKDRLKKRTKEQGLNDEPSEMIADQNLSDPLEKLSIEEGMSRLTIDHRGVLLLHEVQGYRYEEIAEMIEVPLGTVKSRLFAARIALRKELRKEDQG
ncbi:ECF RNA polymerase sigma factor SigW [Paenibacillus baekrokdamisoli]|uniref:ECF RNA polymerase sigma factor SigW n=1 Tax=Paenibacillus baekrokdamisoli TaxID=1712516 RepID=A0A3G9INF2_9BACL|nr:sigma-70 family RNA polymerase sigma factor [Paenibacillus baekrokdamisoli]BBH20380.1 ECF RNA polymerase sigma factor SigW [Paenibacillus baekrokdamisoli]